MFPLALLATLAPSPPMLRTPDVHGNLVAFSCEGDIWVGDLATGRARRLTTDPGLESRPRFSPDGSQIAFSAQYDGAREVYVMPTEGGAPRRLTHRNDYADCLGWTADGQRIVYRGRSIPRSYAIYTVPVRGGAESKLPLEFAASADLQSTRGFVFTRFNRQGDAWFHYKGGMQNQVWFGDPRATRFRAITSLPDTCEYPVWAGDRVCFVQQQDATFTVWSERPDGSDRRKLAGPYDLEVKELHGDADHLVYEKGVGVEMADVKTGRIQPVSFELDSDLLHTIPYQADPTKYVESVSVTTTGKRELVASRGQILSLPIGEGEARVWKCLPGARLGIARMSPDSKHIGYVSDQTGEQNIWIADVDGSNPKLVTTKPHKRQILGWHWSPNGKWISVSDSEHVLSLVNTESGDERVLCRIGSLFQEYPISFSPDSRWITYNETDPISSQTSLAIYDIEKSEFHRVGLPFAFDGPASFSSNGKYLVFTSALNFSVHGDQVFNQIDSDPALRLVVLLLRRDVKNPLLIKNEDEEPAKPTVKSAEPAKNVEIDFDGLYDRRVVLPLGAQEWGNPVLVGERVIAASAGQIRYYDLEKKKEGIVTAGGAFQLTDDGKKLFVGDHVVDVTADNAPVGDRVGYGGLRIAVDPVAEWKQIYWDAWRLLRDWFYVGNMNGADWDAIGKKYAAFLPRVRSRWELDELIRWLQAEMGCSHEYLSAGDNRVAERAPAGAYLGIDTAPDPSRKLKIVKVYRGDQLVPAEMSPLAEAGIQVKEGSFLLEIAGQPMTADSDYREALVGRAGQPVSILVNDKPTTVGASRFTVKPVPLAAETRIRQVDWVESNRRYVDKASGGKVGYLHLWAMVDADMSDLIRQYFAQRNKDALVVDVRFNNGGYTQDYIIRILNEKLSGYFNSRNGPNWTRQQDFFAGPMACLINEFNVSCGEEFPYHFRDLHLGPLIGRRTYGGEVGSSPGWRLVDGGVINVPDYGMWVPGKGWVIEAEGVAPDPGFDVPSDPNAYLTGHDPQLDKAVAYLMDQIAKHPVVRPVSPPPPVRVRKG
jgi:tricorn protease